MLTSLKKGEEQVHHFHCKSSYYYEYVLYTTILGCKFDAAKLSADMRHEVTSDGKRMFAKEEFLTAQQITSFWSRYASNARVNAAAAREEALRPQFPDVPVDESQDDPNIPTEEDKLRAAFDTDAS